MREAFIDVVDKLAEEIQSSLSEYPPFKEAFTIPFSHQRLVEAIVEGFDKIEEVVDELEEEEFERGYDGGLHDCECECDCDEEYNAGYEDALRTVVNRSA